MESFDHQAKGNLTKPSSLLTEAAFIVRYNEETDNGSKEIYGYKTKYGTA